MKKLIVHSTLLEYGYTPSVPKKIDFKSPLMDDWDYGVEYTKKVWTDDEPEHTITICKDSIKFYCGSDYYSEEWNYFDNFETGEDVWGWIQGWLDDVLDQEYD